MIFKLDLKKVGYLTMIMGAINIFASPLGYVPYSYKISTEDGDFKKRDSFENFEDNIFIKPIGTNPILDTLSSEYGFELEELNSSAPLLISSILSRATLIYNSNDVKESKDLEKILKDTRDKGKKKSKSKSKKKRVAKKKNKSIKKSKKPSSKKSKILYEVKKGDSFIKLAKKFDTTVFDIKRWNKIKDRDIVRLGEKLTIYPSKKTPSQKIKEILKLENYGRYKVQPGDTLSSIIKKFAVDKKETKEINKIKNSDSIKIGQKLVIPLPQKKIDIILKKIEDKKRAEKLALKRKYRLEMARRGRYKVSKVSRYRFKRRIRVVATAYTSHVPQTDMTPFLAAWNNRISPGMKIIAVSNDLIRKYGITNGTKVRISGLPGVYIVRDKMHPKLRNHIDIYMGTNLNKALRWGRRRVILYW